MELLLTKKYLKKVSRTLLGPYNLNLLIVEKKLLYSKKYLHILILQKLKFKILVIV